MVILGIPSEEELHSVRKRLVDHGIRHCHFYEPDIGDELTSLASEPITGKKRRLFSKYKLLGSRKVGAA